MQRLRWSPAATIALLVALTTLVDWPVPNLTERFTNSLDGSWAMVMHLWGHQLPGLGPHVDFTYGPLGFLALPTLWYSDTGTLAWFTALVVTAACATVAIARLRARLPLWAAVVVGLLVVRTLMLFNYVAALPIFAFWWIAGARPATLRRRIVALVLLALVADTLLLIRFGDGLILAGLVVIAPFVWADRPWRELAVAVGALVVGLFALWSVVTLSPGQLPHYLKASSELANGYWQMSRHKPVDAWPFVAAPLLGLGVLGLLAGERGPVMRRAALAVATVWLGWLEFKHGFTRSDGHHMQDYFIAITVIALAIGSWRWRWSVLRVVVTLTALLTTIVIAVDDAPYWTAWQPTQRFFHQATTLASPSDRSRLQDAARAEIQRRMAVPADMLATIGRSTVQVDPHQAYVAWAYGLRLAPVPVFQMYTSYTTWLDDENARALSGSRAPEFILRNQRVVIGRRFAAWESPRYQLAVLCHYSEVLVHKRWQLLEHSAPKCGARQRLSTVPLRGVVIVPDAPPNSIVVATFHLRSSLVDRAKRALFRDFPPFIDVNAQPFRIDVGTAGEPHLLVVPPSAPRGPHLLEQLDVQTLHPWHPRSGDTVTFWTIPYAGAG